MGEWSAETSSPAGHRDQGDACRMDLKKADRDDTAVVKLDLDTPCQLGFLQHVKRGTQEAERLHFVAAFHIDGASGVRHSSTIHYQHAFAGYRIQS